MESPYRRGADDGFKLGLYFAVMFFAGIFSENSAMLSLLSTAMMALVPFVAWRLMRAYSRDLGVFTSFAMRWMYGVMLFLCGMLVAGSMLVVYLKWVNPDYVSGQLAMLADLADSQPDGPWAEAGTVARDMLDANFIPSASNLVLDMIMLAVVTGSLLTLALSAIMSLGRPSGGVKKETGV